MVDYKNNIVSEFYSNLSDELLILSHKFFENKYSKQSNLNIKIHNYYYKLINNGEFQNLNKLHLFDNLYPGKEYKDSILTTALNRHIPDLKEFVMNIEAKTENIYVGIIWSDFLLEHKMKRNVLYNIKRKKVALGNKHVEPLEQYFNAREDYFFNLKFNQLVKSFEGGELLRKYIADFETYAEYTKIQLHIGLIAQLMQSNDSESINKLAVELGTKHDPHMSSNNFYLSTNAMILKLYLSFNDEIFNLLFRKVLDNLILLEISDKIYYINNLLNFIFLRFKEGFIEFKQKEYNLYLELDKMDVLDLGMTYRKMINIIYACLYTKNTPQALYFLKKYSPKLPSQMYTSAYSLNMARIHFAQSNYHETLRELNNVDYSTSNIYINIAKKLEVQSLISLNELTTASQKLNALNKFIKDSKNIHDINNLTEFYTLARTLLKFLNPKNAVRIDKEKIDQYNLDQIDKEWAFNIIQDRNSI